MTTYAKQYYIELISQQIEANEKDADELMVGRCYEVTGFATLVREFMLATGQPLKRDAYARGLALAIESAVLSELDKYYADELESMQTPDPDDFDDVQADGNAMLDKMGARRV